ncbi:type IX secretion system anionic LPS delivery protein PorZ [Hymenobacter weizhouensis]|uniref:type IX secretion system anionic LPS delivery protein PorZ n=1 Tax=Hymenobacter sp. YIM 151500-1 TaxID=2987689 RepID=UPI002226E4DC|nr:two-component regulator propeller domain-containing protein [Hymenobacter sp. YIM 151500-1]UYZ61690.1 T9SS type A sorting domain-containing protein [Hymenobacter sp. YIM 151500-1]
MSNHLSLLMPHFRRCSWVLLACLLLLTSPAGAQSAGGVGFGDWQLHLPTNRATALAEAGSRVYVATADAFFYYDKELNTTRLLSRRDGLSDVGVSALAYDSVGQQLVVAYRNTNLDLLRLGSGEAQVRNLTDILRKEISGSKVINHIHLNGRLAYLATSFGIVVLDVARLEIRDTYTNIGPGGTVVRAYATAVAGGFLLAATSNGLMRARLTSNLLDFRSWTTDLPARPNDPYRTLAVQDGRVFAGVSGDKLYRFDPAAPALGWQAVSGAPTGAEYRQLTASRAGLLLTTNQPQLTVLNPASGAVVATLRPALLQDPRAALRGREGAFYVADFRNGLLKIQNQQAEQFTTNAPARAQNFSVLADARTNSVTVFSGGYSDRYLQRGLREGFSTFQNGQWTTVNATLPAGQYPNLLDVSRGVRTPDGTLYVASYGNGLLEWKGPGAFRLFNPTTGQPNPLRSAIADPNFTRVTDLAATPDGDVWVVNRHQVAGQSGLFVFSPVAGTWRTVPYFGGSENLDRIALDEAGNAWVSRARAPGGTQLGMVALRTEDNTVRSFSEADGLPSGEVYKVVKDRRGDIWVATLKGPAVFNDPLSAFDPGLGLGFRAPIVRRGDGTGFPALVGEAVRTLAVDGGNRKWFGTDRGLWLFNEDGDEALRHFTAANSPLPSDRIVDVAVNDRTGEVFVVTDAGVVSYRGDATVTEGKPSCAKVAPNPVRTNFTGQVGISGLANNGIVKITDVTGKLVYETRANGGTVTWNLADYNGRRVQSGVYLVLSSDQDGKNPCISKVAVVEK